MIQNDVILSLLRSLDPGHTGEEDDEDDAEGERQHVDDQDGEGPPVQAWHNTRQLGSKQVRRWCYIYVEPLLLPQSLSSRQSSLFSIL